MQAGHQYLWRSNGALICTSTTIDVRCDRMILRDSEPDERSGWPATEAHLGHLRHRPDPPGAVGKDLGHAGWSSAEASPDQSCRSAAVRSRTPEESTSGIGATRQVSSTALDARVEDREVMRHALQRVVQVRHSVIRTHNRLSDSCCGTRNGERRRCYATLGWGGRRTLAVRESLGKSQCLTRTRPPAHCPTTRHRSPRWCGPDLPGTCQQPGSASSTAGHPSRPKACRIRFRYSRER
jgi:hypothetical protein